MPRQRPAQRLSAIALSLAAILALACPGLAIADTRARSADDYDALGDPIDGPSTVCPVSTNGHCGQAGMASYTWSVSGSGTIVGPTNTQCVQVQAGAARLGDYTLDLSFIDLSGGAGTAQKVVAIVDTIPPAIVCPRDRRAQCGESLEFGEARATDNCDPSPTITWCDTRVPGNCPGDFLMVRTWFAVDDAGNKGYRGQRIIVTDRTPPVIACPPDATFEIGENIEFGWPAVSDGCDRNVNVTYEDRRVDGSCAETFTTVRTWTATDDCGNSASCEQRVTVADRTPPEITCPGDRTFECNQTVEFGQATAVDAVDPDPEITWSDNVIPGNSPQQYVIERTWKAADDCGNFSTCRQTVSVVDTTGPVLVGAPDGVLFCDQPVVFTDPTAADNCDPDPQLVVVSDAAQEGPGGCVVSYTRCWEARDASGNVSNRVCQTIMRYEDTIAPVVTCGPQKVIQLGEPVIFDEPMVTDNCPVPDAAPPQLTSVLSTSVAQQETSYTRCWLAYDLCGNQSNECCQTIVVEAPPEPPPYCTFVCWNWTAACLEEDSNHDISTPPACLRDEHFFDAFPQGVTIGTHASPGLFTSIWTSPGAVERFKCGYGLPEPLHRDWVDPRNTDLGVLQAEILTLKLNREFSCGGYFEAYGYPLGEGCFGEFVIPPEVLRFAGLTIDQFLAVADRAVAGDKSALLPYGYSYFRLYAAAAYVNWLFGECNGYGTRQDGPPSLLGAADGDAGGMLPEKFSMTGAPNPLRASVTISLALPAEADVALDIYDVQGRVVTTLVKEHKAAGHYNVTWNGTDDFGGRVVSGVYFCRVQIDGQLAAMEKLMKL